MQIYTTDSPHNIVDHLVIIFTWENITSFTYLVHDPSAHDGELQFSFQSMKLELLKYIVHSKDEIVIIDEWFHNMPRYKAIQFYVWGTESLPHFSMKHPCSYLRCLHWRAQANFIRINILNMCINHTKTAVIDTDRHMALTFLHEHA